MSNCGHDHDHSHGGNKEVILFFVGLVAFFVALFVSSVIFKNSLFSERVVERVEKNNRLRGIGSQAKRVRARGLIHVCVIAAIP